VFHLHNGNFWQILAGLLSGRKRGKLLFVLVNSLHVGLIESDQWVRRHAQQQTN
jgi:hypothetical protein